MKRRGFLTLLGSIAAVRTSAGADEQYDPAQSASEPEVRVWLGHGPAAANPDGTFNLGDRTYRGAFVALPDGSIVSTVSVEDYLASVVPKEMPPSWPPEALKAQAICARTFVLARSNPRRDYDLVPSELDQVYEGISSETPAGRAAVDATRGQVLRYEDGFAQAMYSSCCGGHTEASSAAWGGSPIPYLNGVVCTYCTQSPNYRWRRELSLASIGAAYAPELAEFGDLREIRVAKVDSSGRAQTLELVAARGSAFVKGSTFRMRVGTRMLPSLLITEIEPSAEAPERVAIEGGGLGHGVGLCQWGARGMANTGATSTTILNLYFPGTMIGHD